MAKIEMGTSSTSSYYIKACSGRESIRQQSNKNKGENTGNSKKKNVNSAFINILNKKLGEL